MMTNHGNRVTQGQFSFLPDLTDAQITKQIEYALKNDWAVSIEYTDDPHPRNTYWEMFGNPMFDLKDPAGILMEINNCRKTFPNHYIRVTAFDSSRGWETPLRRGQSARRWAAIHGRSSCPATGSPRPRAGRAASRHRAARPPSSSCWRLKARLPQTGCRSSRIHTRLKDR